MVEISQNFVAFSEYMFFMKSYTNILHVQRVSALRGFWDLKAKNRGSGMCGSETV